MFVVLTCVSVFSRQWLLGALRRMRCRIEMIRRVVMVGPTPVTVSAVWFGFILMNSALGVVRRVTLLLNCMALCRRVI